MKLLPRFVLALIVLLAALASACDIDIESEDGDPPTAVIITSTPDEDGTTDEESSPTEDEAAEASPTSETGSEPIATTALETPTTSPGDKPTATEPESPPLDDPAQAEIEAIEQDVVELRGLDLLEDLDEQVINREELSRRIQEIIEEEYSPEEARIDALTYWLLRLIPDRSLDLYQLQIDLLSEQVAGYYDPETDELVVVTNDGTLTVTDKVTMAHEIVHALQDQHFDLIAIDENAIDSDHEAAITALIEGDATLAMTDYMLGYLDPLEIAELLGESFTAADTAVLDSAPRYIRDGLLFSYEAGQLFATAIYESGDGYEAINAAFEDPPASSEQILHPEKYIGPNRDEPIPVENPDISNDLGSGWELVRGDVLGEWDLGIMLEENGLDSGVASTAVEGWGGSWFDIYESDSGALALLTTRWDSNEDASEFADALVDSLQNGNANGEIWFESDRYFSVVEGGDTVVMISSTDRAAVESALAIIEQTV